jgi:hypothetical protein
MKILSIDVGIKNLAFCLFEKHSESPYFKITKWDVVNVSEKESHACCFIEKTVACNKPAKYVKDKNCYCLKHSKKQQYKIPTSETKTTFISKQKIQKLQEIATKYGIQYDLKIKKDKLVSLINEHIRNTYFQQIETKNASKIDLVEIGTNLKHKFNELFSDEGMIHHIIIENQISPIANRMKTIQGMIVQYFIMSSNDFENVEFISAANKLKDCHAAEKSKYSDRKKLGISICLDKITNNPMFEEHVEYFNKHKKKDDLADSFLQGLWFIQNKIK